VAAAINGIALKCFSRNTLTVMATAAGFALLTRVSLAVGLYAGLGMLMMALIARATARGDQYWNRLVPPALILLLFLLLCGFVNFQRWGNPLVFADYALYNYNAVFPDRLPRMHEFGLFNIARLPFGLVYFFAPIWPLQAQTGQLMFAATQLRLLDAVELPPSSFLLTDALLIGLFGFAARRFISSIPAPMPGRTETIAIGLGLLAPALLMLTAISMNYRYRMDFYPLFEFGAFIGLIAFARRGPEVGAGWRKMVWTAAVVSIVASHLSMAVYRLSDLGPAQPYLKNGIISYYARQL
jgi:hypothetical protein